MHVISGVNVHSILPKAMRFLHEVGGVQQSRNGDVIRANFPVATVYAKPTERVMFHPWRDANPFFHFYESLWMLAGRSDVAPLARYVKRMESFSDDGLDFNAAYGHRWRQYHEVAAAGYDTDQLSVIVKMLRENPDDRRAVLQIWSAGSDLGATSKDVACNVAATFQIRMGALNMVVFCRSNDIIWGCYGANAVHFSMLQEYVARAVGANVGDYTQISVNWHAYVDVFMSTLQKMGEHQALDVWEGRDIYDDPYSAGTVEPYPIMSTPQEQWDADCIRFVTLDGRCPGPRVVFNMKDPFFRDVAGPIVLAHDMYQDGGPARTRAISNAISVLDNCAATDWKRACVEWLKRRVK